MGRPKADTIALKVTMAREVSEAVREDATAFGLSIGGYLSMLAMQARMQRSAISFVSNLTQEQIQTALTDGKTPEKPKKKASN